MAYTLADRVQETTDAAGIGNVTLQGAVAGYRTFASALSNGAVVPYVITDGTAWETGSGTYNAGVLTRTTVKASSNANAAITVAAGMKVFIDLTTDALSSITAVAPVDLTNATVDYLLAVGETAVLTYTNATSVPLHVQTVEGAYELIIIDNGSTNYPTGSSLLLPNNSALTAGSVGYIQSSNSITTTTVGTTQAPTGYINSVDFTGIPVAYGVPTKMHLSLSTFTKNKTAVGSGIIATSSTAYESRNAFSKWEDTSTVWTSLGTITFPLALSGKIVIKRII